MSSEGSSRQRLLANLLGKSVADQANAGFIQMWKRSDLYRSIVNDEKMFDFVELMAQINDGDMDEQIQAFYTAVQSYNADVGHVDNVAKIQECLDKALIALAIKKITVAQVVAIRDAGTTGTASPNTGMANNETKADQPADLPEMTVIAGSFTSKQEFVDSLQEDKVCVQWYLSWPRVCYLHGSQAVMQSVLPAWSYKVV